MSNTDKEIKEAVNPQDLGLTPEQQENFEDVSAEPVMASSGSCNNRRC